MSATQWTFDVVIFLIVASALGIAIGYLAARMRQAGAEARSAAQLDQTRLALESAQAEAAEIRAQLKDTETQSHQQQLAHGRLEEQLTAARANTDRMAAELTARLQEFETLSQKMQEVDGLRHAAEKQLQAAHTEGRGWQERMTELAQRLTGEQSAFKELQDQHQTLSRQHTELKTSLERREEHFKEQMAQLADTRQSLTREFENLANKIFDEKGKTFSHTSQTSIDTMLKPFREQIEGFQKRINEVHDASLKDSSSLNAEIKKVLEIGLTMSQEANNLTSALKGDSQQRGAWGEAQLRRTLEMSGLIEEDHFDVQTSFKDADGRTRQTDYLIKLPDGKHIVIDSKVSLNAYDRAVSAETPEAGQLAMVEHVRAVRRHIDDLASKDYTNLVGMRSPNFVLMFMPIEPAYIEALKSNRDLFEYGYKKGVVLVSHTTLIPILRTVSNLWMIERSNAEARQISERAGDIYNQVCIVAERLSRLGGTLGTVSNHYNSAVTALAGKQGLYGKVERFNQLSAKVTKLLPELEPAHMDFESDRLALIVEAVEEPDEEADNESDKGFDKASDQGPVKGFDEASDKGPGKGPDDQPGGVAVTAAPDSVSAPAAEELATDKELVTERELASETDQQED